MFSTPGDVETGVRIRGRSSEAQRQLLQLQADHRDLHHPRRHVEVQRRPPPGGGDEHHPGVGIDHDRMADGGQHRRVVGTVGVGVARGEIDIVLVGPRGDRRQLPGRPHERPGQRAVVEPVRVHRVPGGHDVVEPEAVGERLDEVVGRGGGEHDRPSGGAMRGERRLGERLDHADEPVGNGGGRLLDGSLGTALGERHRLAGERHRRQRLADRVEHAEQDSLPGDRPRGQPGESHRLGEHLPRRAAQQRAIEIEERRTVPGGTGRGGRFAHLRHTTSRAKTSGPARGPKNGKDPDGGSGSLNLGIPTDGGSVCGFPSSGTWGVFSLRSVLLVKVCT